MRKFLMLAALSAAVCLVAVDMASARGGRGGCHSSCGGGGCYSSYSCCGSGYGGGCYGGGYGGGCYGGGCYGGGCYGGGYGGGCYGGGYATSGCYGGGYGGGCYGGGYGGGYGGASFGSPIIPMSTVPGGSGGSKDGRDGRDGKGKTGGTDDNPIAAPATLLVTLPADAALKIDNYQTTSTSGTRVFTTPSLEPGKEFSYKLTASVVRDGKTREVERVVKVRAGETTPVTLDVSEAVAAR